MNSTFCWMCSKELFYEGEKYQDVDCNYCGAQNSIYNSDIAKPLDIESNPFDLVENDEIQTEEEEMIDYNDEKYQGKFVYLPLMGQTAEFDIAEINEVKSDNPKFNFSENVPVMLNGEQVIDDEGEPCFKKKDLGYHVEAKLKNGKILSITSMAALIAVFKKNNIQDGEKIRVFHKEKGLWEVEKL